MTDKRIAIYGLGRSGLAIARAALHLGAVPVVYDKAAPEQMVKQDVLEAVRELGVELHLGWEGRFDPASMDMLVTNPGADSRSAVLQNAAADGIDILSEVEFAYRVLVARGLAGRFAQISGTAYPQPPPSSGAQTSPQEGGGHVPIVAITGTNGKSTTTVMTYLALRECGIDAVLCGNIFGTGLPEVPLTEAALNAVPGQVLVAEISSFQLEWVSQFRPAVAGITNIAPDHLDRYDSFQQYADTKMRIFAGQGEGDYAVVRAFDPVVRAPGMPPALKRRRGTAFQAVSVSGFQPEIQSLEGSDTHRLEGDATIVRRMGANLPHWTAEGATYAVRFRLADSIPKSLAHQWASERLEIDEAIKKGELSPRQKFDSERLLSLKIDRYLDGGHGSCVLRRPEAAQTVASGLQHFDGERYEVYAWCVMPNHVHVLVRAFVGQELDGILHSWKSFTANRINQILEEKGHLWQKESYDHLVRDERDFQNQRAYILGNPAAAGMKNWPWSGSGFQPEIQSLEGSDTHRLEGDATVLTFGSQGEHGQVMEDRIQIFDKAIKTDEMQIIGTHNYANAAMAGLMAYATLRWLRDRDDGGGKGDGDDGGEGGDGRDGGQLVEQAQTASHKSQATSLPDCILTALKSFKGIEHRMEFLGEKDGVKVINNSMCTNPDAVVKSAQAVKGPNHLIMGGKDKDLPFAPVKNYLANGMHKAYLFGEAKEVLNAQLGGGFPTYNTLQDAFRAATEKARPGEVIMLAPGCASTDQFNDFRDRGNVFKKIAKEWLES